MSLSAIPVCFTDLDDTLFSTAEKFPEGTDFAHQATEANNGRHSWMSASHLAMFNWLQASTTLIPVTARAPDSYARVRLDFRHGAVLSNGALILLPDGAPDPVWRARMTDVSRSISPFLHEMKRLVDETFTGDELRTWIVDADGLDSYFCVKVNKADDRDEKFLDGVFDILRDRIGLEDAIIHMNGNNLSVVPKEISKKIAVEYLVSERPDLAGRPTIGAGDSVTDLPFMQGCDMMMVPGRSQVSTKLTNLWGWTNVRF
jgi:hydroxymethylpyrimidine pyrophosphatase-like HAD family hydrolase